MDDETLGVNGEPVAPAESPTDNEQGNIGEETDTSAELVDESGIPLKNRIAEKERKLKRLSSLEAQEALLKREAPASATTDNEAALNIVKNIAEESISKRLEPLLAKQFLLENPEAAAMIEDINSVRSRYPELASVEKLDVAYKIARAEKQDEIIRQQVDKQRQEEQSTLQKAKGASVEGTGRGHAAEPSLVDKIGAANSLEELHKLEAALAA